MVSDIEEGDGLSMRQMYLVGADDRVETSRYNRATTAKDPVLVRSDDCSKRDKREQFQGDEDHVGYPKSSGSLWTTENASDIAHLIAAAV